MRIKTLKDLHKLMGMPARSVYWMRGRYNVLMADKSIIEVECEEASMYDKHAAVSFLLCGMKAETFQLNYWCDQYTLYLGDYCVYVSRRCKKPFTSGQRQVSRLIGLRDKLLKEYYENN